VANVGRDRNGVATVATNAAANVEISVDRIVVSNAVQIAAGSNVVNRAVPNVLNVATDPTIAAANAPSAVIEVNIVVASAPSAPPNGRANPPTAKIVPIDPTPVRIAKSLATADVIRKFLVHGVSPM